MQIHYFQRYHSKENVDTSNTMLMLSRLYNYNADKFFSMLNSLILAIEVDGDMEYKSENGDPVTEKIAEDLNGRTWEEF